MSVSVLSDHKKKLGTLIPASLDMRIEIMAARADVTKQSLIEHALRLMVVVAEWGVPDDLGELLQARDPELLDYLAELHKALRGE